VLQCICCLIDGCTNISGNLFPQFSALRMEAYGHNNLRSFNKAKYHTHKIIYHLVNKQFALQETNSQIFHLTQSLTFIATQLQFSEHYRTIIRLSNKNVFMKLYMHPKYTLHLLACDLKNFEMKCILVLCMHVYLHFKQNFFW
jgi:hypothetical protein